MPGPRVAVDFRALDDEQLEVVTRPEHEQNAGLEAVAAVWQLMCSVLRELPPERLDAGIGCHAYTATLQKRAADAAHTGPGRTDRTVSTRRNRDADDRRLRIFRRDDFTCVYCGQRFEPDGLTVDHVEPRVKGGDNSEGNLVTACTACNTEKGGAPAWAYLARRPEKRDNFLRLAASVWPRLRRAVEEAVRED